MLKQIALTSHLLFAGCVFAEIDSESIPTDALLLSTVENRVYNTQQVNSFAEGLSMAVVAASRTRLNIQALDSTIENGRSYRKNGEGKLTGQSFYLSLPGEPKPLLFQVKTVSEYIPGITTYSGKVADDEYSFFALSNENKRLTGKIIYRHYTYMVKADPKSSDQIIIKIDPLLVPRDPDDTSSSAEEQTSKNTTITNKSAASGHIRILFLYAYDVSMPTSTATIMLAEFNTALADSGITGKSVSSAGIISLSTNFSGQCKADILDDMRANVGIFSNLDQLRTNANADIVFTMVNDQGPGYNTCFTGFSGRVGGRANQSFNINHPVSISEAFAVTVDTYMLGDSTGIHEVGHILGAFHETQFGNKPPRLGLVNPTKNWQTLMGSYDVTGCDFTGPSSPCVRLNRFSNPNQSYLGDPLGTVANNNVSDWLQTTAMNAVSGYKDFTPPVPDAPTGLTVVPDSCYGFHYLNWTGNDPDTLSYQLYYSTQSNFSNPSQLYNGLDKGGLWININSSIWYLRVKACNAGGCSAYSNQVVAVRVNYCL